MVKLLLENQRLQRFKRSSSHRKEGASTINDIDLELPMSLSSRSSVSASNSSNSFAARVAKDIQINNLSKEKPLTPHEIKLSFRNNDVNRHFSPSMHNCINENNFTKQSKISVEY